MAVYGKAAVHNCKLLELNFRCLLLITWLDTVEVTPRPKAHFEVACKSAVYSKVVVYNKKFERKVLPSQCPQCYEKNSCKPGVKYFTLVNCQFTLVNCWFTLCKLPLYCKPPVYTCKLPVYCNPLYERPLAEDSNFSG